MKVKIAAPSLDDIAWRRGGSSRSTDVTTSGRQYGRDGIGYLAEAT
jgi:hypothetical protein